MGSSTQDVAQLSLKCCRTWRTPLYFVPPARAEDGGVAAAALPKLEETPAKHQVEKPKGIRTVDLGRTASLSVCEHTPSRTPAPEAIKDAASKQQDQCGTQTAKPAAELPHQAQAASHT